MSVHGAVPRELHCLEHRDVQAFPSKSSSSIATSWATTNNQDLDTLQVIMSTKRQGVSAEATLGGMIVADIANNGKLAGCGGTGDVELSRCTSYLRHLRHTRPPTISITVECSY